MKQLLIAVSILVAITAFANDERTVVNAHLQSVTVYRSGAEMVHTATATLKEGSNELVIDQLGNSIDVNSIQVKVSDGITILGTEFSNNHLTSPVKTFRIKLLEDSLESLNKSLAKIDSSISIYQQLESVLNSNTDIKGAQTGLSVAELMKFMDYYKTKTTELQTEIAQLQEKERKLKEATDKVQKELEEENNKNTSTTGRITLQIQVATTGKYTFEVSYIALNAGWNPFYDLRVDDIKNPINLIYKANISQSTGLDWKQVKLSLSTATPNQSGTAPQLNPWFLGYLYPRPKRIGMGSPGASPEIRIRGASSITVDEALEGKVAGLQVNKKLEDHITVSDNTLNVTFDIDILYDIPTNGKEQTAVLKTYQVPATYKHSAIPKLDKDAYIIADILDWEKLNLLPGNANVILEGTYTGKTFIDPNTSQDTLSLTLGKDKRVAIKRDKLVDYSSVKFLGSNKLQKFTYEITVKNNKKDPINLDLKDQFPLTTNKDIEVELVDAGGASANNDTGVLNWLVTIPAGESKKFKFTYSIKYPKDRLVNLQ
jgi:uncharacterized protein (TIGR02231 family)